MCPSPDRLNQECKSSAVMVLGRGRLSDSPPIVVGPSATEAGVDNFVSFHPGGANFGMADGSVRFLKTGISPEAFGSLLTRAGGEFISPDSY